MLPYRRYSPIKIRAAEREEGNQWLRKPVQHCGHMGSAFPGPMAI